VTRPFAWPFAPDEATRALAAADSTLAKIIARVGPFTHVVQPAASTFEALTRSIVYQQLHGKAAATIHGRLVALGADGRTLRAEDVAAASDDALRGVGLSRQKMLSLRDLATRTLSGTIPTLDALARLDDDAVVEALVPVRGIGRWSVEMLLMFRLGRPDVLPLDDFGIRKAFALGFPRALGKDARGAPLAPAPIVRRRGERWRPYRTVASWYLWRSLDPT